MSKIPKQVTFQGDIYEYLEYELVYQHIRADGTKHIITKDFAETSKLVKPILDGYRIYGYDSSSEKGFSKYTYDSSSINIGTGISGISGENLNRIYDMLSKINKEEPYKPVEQPKPKIDTTNYPRIQIEKMLYGDFRVQVWDKNLNSLLDKEYFCCGFNSALQTAMSVKLDSNHQDFKDLPIYLYQDSKEKKLYD